MRVLLVEDDRPLAHAIRTALETRGLIVDAVFSIAMASAALPLAVHDALLLDRSLPDGDGVDFIATARALVPGLPIILLTARGEVVERVEGLNSGADDYVVKPVAVDELLARIRAVVRRPAARTSNEATVGNLVFDFNNREVRVLGAGLLKLQRRQLLILEALMFRQGRTVRRESIHEAVYGLDDEIQSNALDAHISKLRKRLESAHAGVTINVVRGVGYLLSAAR